MHKTTFKNVLKIMNVKLHVLQGACTLILIILFCQYLFFMLLCWDLYYSYEMLDLFVSKLNMPSILFPENVSCYIALFIRLNLYNFTSQSKEICQI